MEKKIVNDINDLANILKLSITTVSRVLNGKAEIYRISPDTKQRVLDAAREYNYIPNQLARGLKLNKTATFGLVIPDISNPFFADIAKSIEYEARSNGYSLMLCDSRENIALEKELINLLLSHKVEGIIVAPVGTQSEHLIQTYISGTPLVIVDRSFPEIDLPSICSDNYQGGFEAVNYLILMGHKKIVCIQGIPESFPNKERVHGFIDALRNNKIPFNQSMIVGKDFSLENGYKQTRMVFSLKDPPTAIFALSNLISLGVLQAIKEIGLMIPDDVSLISFDEQPYSAYLGTPMTTIDQKKSEMGQFAVEILIKQIREKDPGTKPLIMKLKTNLIIRNSVKNLKK